MSRILNSALVLACVLACVYAHGRLMQPPSRSSLWRFDYKTPVNYDDNALFCGGFWQQYGVNNGKCGICGDDYSAKAPRDNELGGKYGVGVIAKTSHFKSGQKVNVTIEITANHRGYFEYRLCPLTNFPKEDATEECLDKHLLKLDDGTTRYQVTTGRVGSYYMNVNLPTNLTCEHCVFQWHYNSGNNWGDCGNGTGAIGCGPQETFMGCSDIVIS